MNSSDVFHNQVTRLIRNVACLFAERQQKRDMHPRAKRGRVVNVTSDFQDAFAAFLIEVLPEEYRILIDYPVSFRFSEFNKARTIYPDILVTKNNKIEGIFELKVDLGYTSADWLAKKEKEFARMKSAGSVTFTSISPGNTRAVCEFAISPDAVEGFIVLSALNDHGKIKKLKGTQNFFVVTGGWHPAMAFEDDIDSIIKDVIAKEADLAEWNRLKLFLNAGFGPLNFALQGCDNC